MRYLISSMNIEYGEDITKEVTSVVRVVRSKIVSRNLFGWRTFIDDVLIDVVKHMINTEFQYSGGAYVAVGMQIAIDAARYCSAQKRRGNYETVSIHSIDCFMKDDKEYGYSIKVDELVEGASEMLDKETTEEVKKFLLGEIPKLSADVLAKCRTPEFVRWLKQL